MPIEKIGTVPIFAPKAKKSKLGQSPFFPEWIKRPMPIQAVEDMNSLLKSSNLHTICQSARCPNIGECFENKEATFMILGNVCTRNCNFCSVKSGIPKVPDMNEPDRIAKAIKKLGLEYVVLTSVTRDDLTDKGAGAFVATIQAIRTKNDKIKIEILTPDFDNCITDINSVIKARPDVFAHNIETIPSLYSKVRPHSNYATSLSILSYVKNNSDILTKSGIMLGLGETQQQTTEIIRDIHQTGCDILTIGQYLKPKASCLDVKEFIRPEMFDYYKKLAQTLGFTCVLSAPFVRSSYKAKETYEEAIEKHGCCIT